MCCCGKPTINGEPGVYSWDGKHFNTRQPSPPTLLDGDTLLYDEPGRCGGIDAHSHHFQIVKGRFSGRTLLVCHGGGEERIGLGCTFDLFFPAIATLDSNARYWLMHALYSAHADAERSASQERDQVWQKAAAEKRIKVRKLRGRNAVRVSIENPPRVLDAIAA